MSKETFTLDTDLTAAKSPLTADFIDRYLSRKGDGSLCGIGEAVIVAAEKHGINATYIVAHAALETAWGRSRIAKEKNNLFGWSAFDDSPFASARSFPSRADCIDFVVERVKALYLKPGAKYFRIAPCLGRGKTKATRGYGMNANYATDTQWGEKIARIGATMEAEFKKGSAA